MRWQKERTSSSVLFQALGPYTHKTHNTHTKRTWNTWTTQIKDIIYRYNWTILTGRRMHLLGSGRCINLELVVEKYCEARQLWNCQQTAGNEGSRWRILYNNHKGGLWVNECFDAVARAREVAANLVLWNTSNPLLTQSWHLLGCPG